MNLFQNTMDSAAAAANGSVDKGDDAHDDASFVSLTTTRRVMKHLMDTKTVSIEAVTCLSKATEIFMMHFVGEVVRNLDSPQAMHDIRYEDVARAIKADPLCEFLAEMIPLLPTTTTTKKDHHHHRAHSLSVVNGNNDSHNNGNVGASSSSSSSSLSTSNTGTNKLLSHANNNNNNNTSNKRQKTK